MQLEWKQQTGKTIMTLHITCSGANSAFWRCVFR